MAKVWFYDGLTGEEGYDDIPDAVIAQASAAALAEDRKMMIGLHPYFGWVYRDFEDEGGCAELSKRRVCDASGIVD